MNTLSLRPHAAPQTVHLHYREGNSDKVYQVQLEPKDDGFVVLVAYGRRGSALQTGTKTSSPVAYEEALAIFNRLVREKKTKGYTESESGTPYQGTDKANEDTGIRPQLLNPIDEEQLSSCLNDPAYCLQEKFDGKRVLLWKTGSIVAGINRKGLRVGLPQSIVADILRLSQDLLLDGELVGERFYGFDLIHLDGDDLRSQPYQHRLECVQVILRSLKSERMPVIQTAFTSADKQMLVDEVKLRRGEGVVCKRWAAPYQPGRPNSGGDQFKFKFTATCSAIVGAINRQRSVSLQLWDGDKLVGAGNVTVPANQPIPKVASIVEIRYLYAFRESGALYQPVYLHQRDDIDELACTTAQLRYKPSDTDDDQ